MQPWSHQMPHENHGQPMDGWNYMPPLQFGQTLPPMGHPPPGFVWAPSVPHPHHPPMHSVMQPMWVAGHLHQYFNNPHAYHYAAHTPLEGPQGEWPPLKLHKSPSVSRAASLAETEGSHHGASSHNASSHAQHAAPDIQGPRLAEPELPEGSPYDHISFLLREELPKLPEALLSAIVTCLLEAQTRGYARLPLRTTAPMPPEGLRDGTSNLVEHARYVDVRWQGVLVDDLKNYAEAKFNARQYAVELLEGMKHAYLAGLPLPRFAQCHGGYEPVKRQSQGGEKAKAGDDALTELPPHLEQALLQLIQDPSLADPPPHTTQLPPHIQGPPLGTSRDIPQEAQEWLGSRAFSKFHAAALKDIKHLLQDKAGLTLSEDVDFGSHQMKRPVSSAYNLHSTHLPSFRHNWIADIGGRHLYFRPMTAFNRSGSQAILADVRIVPARPHTFALLDDVGVTNREAAAGHPADISGGSANGASPSTRGTVVSLPDGSRYLVTLVMDASDGPHREEESGVLHALVLFTFLVPRSETSNPGWALHGFPSSRNHSCGCCAMLPAENYAVTVMGRRVSVSLARHSSRITSLLRIEARPFVAAALKGLFDQPPASFHGATLKLSALFGEKGHKGTPQIAAHVQRGRALLWAGLGDPSAGSGKGTQQAARYLQRLHRMLRLEETAMEVDICRYDMFNVRLSYATVRPTRRYKLHSSFPGSDTSAIKSGRYLGPSLQLILPRSSLDGGSSTLAVLEVPGLPEGRPALLFGDVVYVRAEEQWSVEYAAAVVAIETTLVFLSMPNKFWSSPPMKGTFANPKSPLFHVRFTFDRTPLRRMHAALEHASNPFFQALPAPKDTLPDSLYTDGLKKEEPAPRGGQPSGPTLEEVFSCAEGICEEGTRVLNFEQRQAVASVLCGAGGRTPFALFGPPGTGKTVTLVECALQVLRREPGARLLLCAPQNFSADLLASALSAKMPPSDMVRLNDPRRPPNQVKADVLPYCVLDEEAGAFVLPSRGQLSFARVVVATCGAAGMLREGIYAAFSTFRFTHVMIDEAGQALLPEALVPLTLLRHEPGCRALLCGDPRQLGPVVRSLAAATGGGSGEGLAVSLLERYIESHQADVPGLLAANLAPATGMLVRNYRSHSTLLQLPNRLFYGSALQAAANQRALLPPRWDPTAGETPDDGPPDATTAWGTPDGAPPDGTTAGGTPDGVAPDRNSPGGPAAAAETRGGAGRPSGSAAALPIGDVEAGESAMGGSAAGHEGEGTAEAPEEVYEDHACGYEEEDALDEEQLPSTLFFGVRGQQVREGEAPSFFNAEEAAALVALVEGLLAQTQRGGRAGVQPNDLGVIATYRKQVQKIRLLLRERGLGAVRVGTVDDYQGQEERFVFISTVLSKPESLPPATARGAGAGDADVHVGFWRNPKRFNVAITRARALLVVVGHPVVLTEDPSWRELLRFCAARGAYRGAGSELMGAVTRAGDGSSGDGRLFGFSAALAAQPRDGEAGEAEVAQAVEAIAELALLGVGSADVMYPYTLDEAYAAYGNEEMEWRVVL